MIAEQQRRAAIYLAYHGHSGDAQRVVGEQRFITEEYAGFMLARLTPEQRATLRDDGVGGVQ